MGGQTLILTGTRGHMLAQLLERDPSLEKVLWKVRLVPGSIALYQQAALAFLAQQYDAGLILNIGTKVGLSTACLACGAPRARIVSLEPVPARVKKARHYLKRYPNVRVIQQKSWDYLPKTVGQSWDMIFLDGCHRQVKRDMPWFDRLTRKGLFLSHDYVPWKFPYVCAALDSLRKETFDVSLIDNKQRGMVGVYK